MSWSDNKKVIIGGGRHKLKLSKKKKKNQTSMPRGINTRDLKYE